MSSLGYNWTPRWTAKKVFAVRSRKGPAAFNGTGLQNKSFQDWAEISKASILLVHVERAMLADYPLCSVWIGQSVMDRSASTGHFTSTERI